MNRRPADSVLNAIAQHVHTTKSSLHLNQSLAEQALSVAARCCQTLCLCRHLHITGPTPLAIIHAMHTKAELQGSIGSRPVQGLPLGGG